MRIPCLVVTFALLPTLAAQELLLQPDHLPIRAQVAADLAAALAPTAGTADLVATTGKALAALPAGSRAHARLGELQERAAATAPDRRTEVLRQELGDLVADLTFTPRMQAELPKGFPGFAAVDEIERRDYPAYRMARTAMKGGSQAAFWPLFRHIEKHEIAMTTPVQMDWRQDGERARPGTMAFLYGDREIGTPGVDGAVEIVDVPAMTVLSLGAIGDDRQDRVAALQQRLQAWVAAQGEWVAAGPVRTMGYNSPMVPRDQRYFEVQLPIQRRPPAAARRIVWL